jgi:exosortase/archaeosortase family protein
MAAPAGAHRRVRLAAAGGLAASGVALLALQHSIREQEAHLSAWVVRASGLLAAHPFGTAVVFPLGRRFAGYSLSPGCTAAFLVAPFCFLFAGAVALAPRLPLSRAAVALGTVAAILFVVNQIRLMVIAAAIESWGFQLGYERSHVFLGTVVSTVGLVFGLVVFAFMAGVGVPDRWRA